MSAGNRGEWVMVPPGFLQHARSVIDGTIKYCQPKQHDEEIEHCGGQCLSELFEVAAEFDRIVASPAPPPSTGSPTLHRTNDGCDGVGDIPAEFAQLGTFYDVATTDELLRQMEGHIEKLQDAARRNVKPWEDTFPPTLLPRYLRENGLPPGAAPLTVIVHTATPPNDPPHPSASSAPEANLRERELAMLASTLIQRLRKANPADPWLEKAWRILGKHGHNSLLRESAELCITCGGKGEVMGTYNRSCDPQDAVDMPIDCLDCDATGRATTTPEPGKIDEAMVERCCAAYWELVIPGVANAPHNWAEAVQLEPERVDCFRQRMRAALEAAGLAGGESGR